MDEELLTAAIYLWTRDAKIPVGEMETYVLARLPSAASPIFSDVDRAKKAYSLMAHYFRRSAVPPRRLANPPSRPRVSPKPAERMDKPFPITWTAGVCCWRWWWPWHKHRRA